MRQSHAIPGSSHAHAVRLTGEISPSGIEWQFSPLHRDIVKSRANDAASQARHRFTPELRNKGRTERLPPHDLVLVLRQMLVVVQIFSWYIVLKNFVGEYF